MQVSPYIARRRHLHGHEGIPTGHAGGKPPAASRRTLKLPGQKHAGAETQDQGDNIEFVALHKYLDRHHQGCRSPKARRRPPPWCWAATALSRRPCAGASGTTPQRPLGKSTLELKS